MSPIMRTFTRGPALAVAAALGLCAGSGWAQDDIALTFSKMSTGPLPAPWHFATLPGKNATEFTVAELDGQHVLRVATQDAYGNMVHALHQAPSASPQLQWRWRVDRLVEKADISRKAGDDSALKLCVSFDFDKSQLSLGERTRLRLGRISTGENIPAETLCYVWDNKQAVGSTQHNAFTHRMRYIVLQSGEQHLGQWVAEQRNLEALEERKRARESSFAKVAQAYLAEIKPVFALSSYRTKESRIRKYLSPKFDGMPMSDIGVKQIRPLLEECKSHGAWAAIHVKGDLSAIFEFAVVRGLVEANPIPSLRGLLRVPFSESKAAMRALPTSAPSIRSRPWATGMAPTAARPEVNTATASELCSTVAAPAPVMRAIARLRRARGKARWISGPYMRITPVRAMRTPHSSRVAAPRMRVSS